MKRVKLLTHRYHSEIMHYLIKYALILTHFQKPSSKSLLYFVKILQSTVFYRGNISYISFHHSKNQKILSTAIKKKSVFAMLLGVSSIYLAMTNMYTKKSVSKHSKTCKGVVQTCRLLHMPWPWRDRGTLRMWPLTGTLLSA